MPAQLTALRGPLAGRTFPLSSTPLTIGRNLDNGIVVASDNASRRHAEVRFEGGSYLLRDLGSSNGTLVNGQRVQAQTLRPGDVIAIGDEVFRLDLIGAQPGHDRAIGATVPVNSLPEPASVQPLPPISHPQRSSSVRRPWLVFVALGVLAGCVLIAASLGGVFLLARGGSSLASATPHVTPTHISTLLGNTAVPVEATALAPVSTSTALAPTSAPVVGGKSWTVLVYLDGDNDLEAYAMTDFNEMERAGSTDDVNVVVQFDRISSNEAWDDRSNGDWSDTRRFLVTHDDDPQRIGSLQLADTGELNMGDPQTLTDFVAWGVQTYPAQHYALIIWDHGSSWPGVAYDATSDNQSLTLPRLDSALKKAQAQSGVAKLDIIGFDACLMSQVDVLETLQPYARVAVASADLEPGDGWPWDRWLGALEADPTQTAPAVAKEIVSSYVASYDGTGDQRVTMAAFDLERFDAVVGAVDSLAQALITDLQPSYAAIGEARSYAEMYAQPQPEEVNAIDLGDFARLLKAQGASATITDKADQLSAALDAARIFEGHGHMRAQSTGLSVYFPQNTKLYLPPYEQVSPLPNHTQWATFLKAFHRAGDVGFSGPTISDLRVDAAGVSPNAPLSLHGTVSGRNLAYVFFFVGTPNADRTGVQLLSLDFVHPPGANQGGTSPNWQDGDNPLSLTWQPTSWVLSNGTNRIPVVLGPLQYGSDSYGVEGLYTSAATGEETSVGLLFTVAGGRGTLQRIWGFPRGQQQDLQPFELKPQPGDTFTALIRTYTDDGTRLRPDTIRGATMAFGAQPFEVLSSPAPTGSYVAGLLVRDVTGQFAYKFTDITIAATP